MDAKLQKIKVIFNKIKDTRIQVVNVFGILEVKLTKLKTMTNDFIKNNHDVLFVFGLDSFKFQSKLIDFEYADMQKFFFALNNRMYCEYYKLFKIVSEYVDKTIGTNKTFEMIKSNSIFPIYKDLEPYKQYSFEIIEEVHKTIILLLGGIQEHIVMKEGELDNYKLKQNSGLNINNFVNTFGFNVIMIKHNLSLFISYLDFFHNIHIKHFKRFSRKMKSMDDYLNEDITFDDSPRRRGSRDFDDVSSQISTITSTSTSNSISNNSTPDVAPVAKPKALPRKSETKSMLKQGVDSVINTFKIFNTKPKLNVSSNNSVSSISSESINNEGNVSLIVEEIAQKVDESLTEFNIANLTRERTATINDELQKDPKYMDKMFEQLTKTLDEPEIHVSKNNKDASLEKFINPLEYELDEIDEVEESFGVAFVEEEEELELEIELGKKKESINVPQNDDENNSRQEDDNVELDDGNLNKLLPLDAISNKKKRKPKKK
jgi:hypothetical protein